MAQVMAPSGGAPTGNPLSDANLVTIGTAGVQVDPTAAAAAINNTNAQQAALASDCLWPPSGQVTLPIIPGLWHQTVSIPCLVSYSEARAVIGAGIFVGGIFVVFIGVNILAASAVLPVIVGATLARFGVRGITGELKAVGKPSKPGKKSDSDADAANEDAANEDAAEGIGG